MKEELKSKRPNLEVKKSDLSERVIDYSLRIIKLYRELRKTDVGRILGQQLLRAATSVGANYHEAQGAQSKLDFISKVSISYKEVLETLYWLRVIEKEPNLSPIIGLGIREETEELIKIFSSILLTSKENL